MNCKLIKTPIPVILTRLVHVIFTVGISATVFVKPTKLQVDLNSGYYFHPLVYLTSVLASLVIYFYVACMDPGFVKLGEPDVKEIQFVIDDGDGDDDIALFEIEKGSGDNWGVGLNETLHNEKTKMLGNEISSSGRANCFNLEPDQRCGLCGLQRPLRAKHCRDCKRCVRKFDHHCPWITNCVGERNHKWFYFFLLLTVSLLIWSLSISITGYKRTELPSNWASENAMLMLVDIVICILIMIVGILLCIHTYLMINNNTTWETTSRHRITYLKGIKDTVNPFNLGICRNVFVFFCNFRPYDWTVVYSKAKATPDNSRVNSPIEIDDLCEISIDKS